MHCRDARYRADNDLQSVHICTEKKVSKMTKIDIISGFLGAGKTTFIKQLLKEAISGEKVVLIENEFGQIGIDGGFLKDAGIEIREMNSGCIWSAILDVPSRKF